MTRFVRVFTVLICFIVTSCGFEIIYKEDKNKDETSYSYELSAIEIKQVKSRLDQIFKNNLSDVFNPDNIKTDKKYFLDFNIEKSVSPTFITQTGSSGRDKITLTATYKLKDLSNSEVIAKGSTIVSDDFNIDKNRFGNYTLEEFTEQNLTKIAAQNIRNLIVSDFIDLKKKK